MSVQLEHWVFSVDEYHRMVETGILSEDDRVKLIEGEIVKMRPIGSRHVACVNRLNGLLNRKVGQQAIVGVQNPFRLDDYSEPEADIALIKPRADFYAESLATPADVLLIIEVADSSVELDRRVKLPLYARAVFLKYGWSICRKIESRFTQSRFKAFIRKCVLLNEASLYHLKSSLTLR